MTTLTAKESALEFIHAFYTQGNIVNYLAMAADDDIIAFGTRSEQYAIGQEEAAHCLQREFDAIAPCKLFRNRIRIKDTADGCSATCMVSLRTAHETSLVLHQLTLMFRDRDGMMRLKGIHLARDLHHEATYRMVCSRMLSAAVENERSRSIIGGQEVLPSYVQSAFITYTLEDERHLFEYNDALWKMLGYSNEEAFREMVGPYVMRLVAEKDRPAVQAAITRQLLQKDLYQVEYAMRRANGEGSLWVVECGHRFLGKDNRPVYQASILDITPLKQASETITYQVSYDDLTGIFNKSAFCQQAQRILDASPDEEFEIMSLDIERFKIINDMFGEDTGNRILKYLADFFRETHLPQSVFARLHSDIFLLFYPAKGENRERFMKSLKVLAASFTLGYRVVLRFGVYRITERVLSVSAMIDRALLALRKSKENGLVDVCEYSATMRNHLMTEQSIINDMNEALTQRQFVIYLQPKYDATSARVVGAEALVRWMHPTRGQIPPSEFVPVFEHNGFIFQVDQYVWEETCRMLRKWLDEGRNPPPVSVNVSRVDFYSTQLVNIFDKLIKKYDLPPALLELELTESAYTNNPQQIIEITKELQSKGFKILMDDFGSGYSSLNMLKELPVDVLKIDLKFLDCGGDTGRGGNILNSIIRMAKWMRMPVVVEGVETKAQADFLRTIGCNYIQGYYFSKPVPVTEFEKLLDQRVEVAEKEPPLVANWPDDQDLEELLNPNTNFSRLFNGIIGGVGLYEFYDGRLELLRANDNFFRLMEAPAEVILEKGKQVLDYIVEEDRPSLLHAIEASRQGRVAECVARRRLLNGTILWMRIRASVILDDGERLLLFLSWEDVTSQFSQQLSLQQLTDCIPMGFVFGRLIGNEIELEYANRWILELDGIPVHGTGVETDMSFRKIVGNDAHDDFVGYVRQAAELKEPYIVEYPFTNYFGRDFWLRAVLNANRSQDGSIAIYANIYDLTVPHEMELKKRGKVPRPRTHSATDTLLWR
ncbi:MAG: EAL domain-containing protein [Schwartzia sp.]|nr:EAL domain-containing protein [Schwartzia sp. (in: firmicutes)]